MDCEVFLGRKDQIPFCNNYIIYIFDLDIYRIITIEMILEDYVTSVQGGNDGSDFLYFI